MEKLKLFILNERNADHRGPTSVRSIGRRLTKYMALLPLLYVGFVRCDFSFFSAAKINFQFVISSAVYYAVSIKITRCDV